MNGAVRTRSARASVPPVEARLTALDWELIGTHLNADGCALIGPVLSDEECRALAATYGDDQRFRSRIVMARHGFGRGEYKYFAYPLPEPVAALRAALYPRLAPIANRWNAAMGVATRYPDDHAAYLERCHRAGQTRPTPLLLRYGAGDYNCLHQDLYGEHVFPLQVAFLLSVPGRAASNSDWRAPGACAGCSGVSDASSSAAASSSRCERPMRGSAYLAWMISPCSVRRSCPRTLPGGCARIASKLGPPPRPTVPPRPWNRRSCTPCSPASRTSCCVVWYRFHCDARKPPSLLLSE